MRAKLSILSALAVMAASLFAEGEGAAAPENSELENELKYIEELVNNGYADFAEPLSEAAKKRWPEAEATASSPRRRRRSPRSQTAPAPSTGPRGSKWPTTSTPVVSARSA